MTKKIYLKATGEAAKKAFSDWFDTIDAAQKKWAAFAASIGALPDRFVRIGFWETPDVFIFDGDVPEGWVKKSPKLNCSRPMKRNKRDIEAIAALPSVQSLENLCAEHFGLPVGVSYETAGGSGVRRFYPIGMKSIDICWVDPAEPILICQDYDHVISTQEGKMTWIPESASWNGVPDGFVKMSQAEVDLAFAQAKVDAEKAAQTA